MARFHSTIPPRHGQAALAHGTLPGPSRDGARSLPVGLVVGCAACLLLPSGCDAAGEGRACDPFADHVVSFTAGTGAGFGEDSLPAIVLGPPVGGGATHGGTDVVSLGSGGTIVLESTRPTSRRRTI